MLFCGKGKYPSPSEVNGKWAGTTLTVHKALLLPPFNY